MDVKHNENFHNEEDLAASRISRDDVPLEDPKKVQEFLQQQRSDWDSEDAAESLENDTERLYQLLKQEGIVINDSKNVLYNTVLRYVESGGVSPNSKTEEKMFPKIAEIDKRDKAGEWEKSYTIGQAIGKAKKQE